MFAFIKRSSPCNITIHIRLIILSISFHHQNKCIYCNKYSVWTLSSHKNSIKKMVLQATRPPCWAWASATTRACWPPATSPASLSSGGEAENYIPGFHPRFNLNRQKKKYYGTRQRYYNYVKKVVINICLSKGIVKLIFKISQNI
jgi:hypothetical protein